MIIYVKFGTASNSIEKVNLILKFLRYQSFCHSPYNYITKITITKKILLKLRKSSSVIFQDSEITKLLIAKYYLLIQLVFNVRQAKRKI